MTMTTTTMVNIKLRENAEAHLTPLEFSDDSNKHSTILFFLSHFSFFTLVYFVDIYINTFVLLSRTCFHLSFERTIIIDVESYNKKLVYLFTDGISHIFRHLGIIISDHYYCCSISSNCES
jgi:hypothetical protein